MDPRLTFERTLFQENMKEVEMHDMEGMFRDVLGYRVMAFGKVIKQGRN